MRQGKLKKWPFDLDERVTVHWFESPKLDVKENRWYVNVIFKDANEDLVPVSYPLGLFSHFRLGDIFINGEKEGRISLKKVDFEFREAQGDKCQAIKISQGIYPLKKKIYLDENCIRYTEDNHEIYIPCFEIARSLFCKTRFLTKALFTPQGLENLVDDHIEISNNAIKLNLSSSFPSNFLKEDIIKYLTWLYFDKKARPEWESVSRDAFETKQYGAPFAFSLSLPINGSSQITALVLERDSYYWYKKDLMMPKVSIVMEIISINKIKLRYQEIEYGHSSLTKGQPGGSSEKKESNGDSEPWIEDEYFVADESHKSETSNEGQVLQPFLPIVQFEDKIIVRRDTRKTKERNTYEKGKDSVDNSTKVNSEEDSTIKEKQEFGANDEDADGIVLPAEYRPIKVDLDTTQDGLENFQKSLLVLKQSTAGKAEIYWDKYEVPIIKDRSFCYIQGVNGSEIRRFILAEIKITGKKNKYLLEIGTLNNESHVYTLLFCHRDSSSKECNTKNLIVELLKGLINNEGHWNISELDENATLKIDKLKHYKKNKNPQNGASYLKNKLSI